jgi:hypothetical protein
MSIYTTTEMGKLLRNDRDCKCMDAQAFASKETNRTRKNPKLVVTGKY